MDIGALTDLDVTQEQIRSIHAARKKIAFERARRSPFFKGRLDHVDGERLDDPEEWHKIPLLTKDQLRGLPAADFHRDFCIAPETEVVEYWRSGGATGRPLFYPRSAFDIELSLNLWRRLWWAAGCDAHDKAHISFPLGIHPVAQLYARSAEMLGIGTIWAGAGTNTPSELQIELIRTLRPTVWAGMGSYGLQLANVADRIGFDLAGSSVKKVLCAAEPLSPSKRGRLERQWGAEVFDQFGCTEGSALGSESTRHDGFHMWSDLFFFEVVDAETDQPVPPGVAGKLIMTPLYGNTVTPFLRWDMGDLGVMLVPDGATGPLSVFPVFRHAQRTSGFFKVRGVNINFADFEDFMYRVDAVADFRLEVTETDTGDALRLSIELRPGHDAAAATGALAAAVKKAFEVTPDVRVLEPGALEAIYARDIKANRFADNRG
jgi:phenylacetate-CoA ligase